MVGPRELGTITVTAAVMLRLAIFITTVEWARAEKPSPPWDLGMIMPNSPDCLMKRQISAGRS